MQARHKKSNEENFPVGFLIKKEYRPLVMKYYNFARYSDDIADNPTLSKEEKLELLDEVEAVLYGKDSESKKLEVVKELREVFIKENFSFSLAADLLKAFRQDAVSFKYETWTQLVDYCQYSAVPVGRFMLALYNENPSTYIPAGSLCVALQIVNHIQDIKYDAELLNRIYIPTELLSRYNVSTDDLTKNSSSEGLMKLKLNMLKSMRGLVKDSLALPSLISSLSLRVEVCIIISLTNIMIKKLENGDVLRKRIKLSKLDWLRATVTGVIKGIFVKRRTSNTKRL